MKSNPSDPQPGVSLWERISRDPNYLKAKRKLQARYALPLPYDIRLDHMKWLDWTGAEEKPTSKQAKRGRAFLKDIHALFKKFEVPETWHDDFIADIAGLSSSDPSVESGNPKFNLSIGSDGNWKWECIVTPETDLTNPHILELIQRGQKEYAGDPPRPVKDKVNPLKLDWRPVYEWHKRHPLFAIEEIAKKINQAPKAVRREFAELEKDMLSLSKHRGSVP